MPQGSQVFHREKPPVRQGGVEAWRSVAFGQNKPIPVRFSGLLGVNTHLFEIKISKHVRSRKAAAGMSGLRSVGAGQDALPDADGRPPESFLFF